MGWPFLLGRPLSIPTMNIDQSLTATIQDVFGRTKNRLPEVFGAPRQDVLGWLSCGQAPERHQARLLELAAAAAVLRQAKVTLTHAALDKPVLQGRTLLQLIGGGESGAQCAGKLVRLMQRGAEAKAKLAAVLGGRCG